MKLTAVPEIVHTEALEESIVSLTPSPDDADAPTV
jgi:hypothetical protein